MTFVSRLSISHACDLTLFSLTKSPVRRAVAQNRKQKMINSHPMKISVIQKTRIPTRTTLQYSRRR